MLWQGCAAGQSGDSCATGTASSKTWSDALAYCDGLDWGGHDDWRLPDFYALQTLLDLGRRNPSIDTAAFPSTPSTYFWSSSSYAVDSNYAWGVNFFYNGQVANGGKGDSSDVRCVRSGPLTQSQRFVRSEPVNNEFVVLDNTTSLIWQGSFAENKTWQEALAYCEGLSHGGHSDWRLPNRHELFSLVDIRRSSPSIDLVAFPGTPSNAFWSSSSYADGIRHAWNVDFVNGQVNGGDKDFNSNVRCVRSGP